MSIGEKAVKLAGKLAEEKHELIVGLIEIRHYLAIRGLIKTDAYLIAEKLINKHLHDETRTTDESDPDA